MGKRFGQTTATQIDEKRLKVNSEKTRRCNAKAAKILRDYLKEQGQNEEFEAYDTVGLSEVLGHFYCDARKPDGEKYKTSSLENIRHSLNRYLRSQPFNKPFDIIKDPEFADANQNFKAVMAELKREGIGTVTHHAVISEPDREKLYTSIHLSPTTPCGLLNKVQFDIRLYFFRRGCEHMHTMTKQTFVVKRDPKSGQKFVTKCMDEMTKNHRENDKENITPIMPEITDSAYCPVSSYELYISKLNPDLDRLWQRPLSTFSENDDVWYAKVPVGQKVLGAFMSEMSKSCELSQVYTNHSIRATGATVLSKEMFGPAQIMAVTGHKSVQSLSVYQRVDDEEKIQMGKTLSE
ncbi:uncharacterized protein LOC125677743 [Ostrea edulis]|uniref:uncharacterized protein LOC125677743 n=1 Tax=Ostrea edulis TaxID=37623 RepID=UPI0024AF2ABA|nr:uncharacterized protein LOC125677743 [Ostrea edulis]